MITSVDRDGTGIGYDAELIKMVSNSVTIPIVAHGGAGQAKDLVHAVHAGADALCLSSILHYSMAEKYLTCSQGSGDEGNLTFIKSKRGFSKVGRAAISDLRVELKKNGVICRSTNV